MSGAPTAEETFARRMRELRTQEDIAQRTLAARLAQHGINLDSTTITRMERGSRSIRLNEAVAVARALYVSIEEMLRPAPSLDEQLQMARQEAKRAEWEVTVALAEQEAAQARIERLASERAKGARR